MIDLIELYRQYVWALEDSIQHKFHLLHEPRCFVEWVQENYPDRMDEL